MSDSRTDPELVAAARGGDSQAFAAIYDRYADRVFGLCTTVTRDRGIAEDATAETFLSAWNRLEQLRDPAQLRPWLFAIARNRAIKLGTRAAKLVPTDTVEDTVSTADTTDAAGTDDAAELQQLVWDAAEGLNPPERAVLDLQVRQGLEESEIALVMGITIEHTYVLTSRMRSGLEKSMGALFIARKGRDDCPELQQVLAGWDGTYSPLIRKRVNRHIEKCATCETGAKRVNPFAAFAAAPAFAAPAALRSRVLNDMQRISFTGDWRADTDGFPTASPGSARRSLVPLILAAAVLVLVLLGGAGFVLTNDPPKSKAAPATTAPSTPATTTGGPSTSEPTTEPMVEPDAATTTTTTRPDATTTTAETTTTTTPDITGPTITGASASPTRVAKIECLTSPKTIAVNVSAADDRGIVGGSVSASIGGATRGTYGLSGGGSSWSTTVGPFPAGTPSGSITLTITVRDAAGNAASTTRFAVLEARCF